MDSENRFQEFGKMITAMQNDFKTLGGINMMTGVEVVSKAELVEMTKTLKEVQRKLEESIHIQDELFDETKRQEKLIEELYDSKDDLYKVVKTLIEENTQLKSSVDYYEKLVDAADDEDMTCSCCEDE